MYHCYAIILTLSLWSSCSTWFHWIFSLVLWFVAIAKLHLRKQISWMSLVGHCFFTEAFMWLKLGLDVIQCDSLSWTLLSDSIKVVFKLLIFLIFQLMEGLPTLLVEDPDVSPDKMASTSAAGDIQLPLRKRGRQIDFKQEGGESAIPILFHQLVWS